MQTGNPITNLLGQTSQPTMNLQPIMQALQFASNPLAALKNMAMQNPQLQGVMNVISQNGGDPKQAFYAMAQQKGIDPNVILQQVKQYGGNK